MGVLVEAESTNLAQKAPEIQTKPFTQAVFQSPEKEEDEIDLSIIKTEGDNQKKRKK